MAAIVTAVLLLMGLVPAPLAFAAVTPVASLAVPATAMIGEAFSFTVTFDNTGTGAETGYGPYVDLFLPIGGADGTSAGGLNDGVSFGSATYLGASVNAVILTCAPGGTIIHPLTGLSVTCPLLPAGFDASFTWQFVNLELPFGSFAADQPPAAITVNANLSNLADLGTALPIQARAGFRYGADPLDNPATDPPIIQAGLTSANITPILIKLTKIYHGPEDETATGPNFPREYTIAVDIANGQTITNLDLTDFLPGNLQFVTVVSTSPTGTCGTQPSTTTPGGNLTCTFASVTGGTGTTDATVRFGYYVPLNDAGSNPVIDASTGDDVQCINQAGALGDWTPVDTRDAGGTDNASAGGSDDPPEHILGCKSIAIQKSVANVTDSSNSPGDVLEYTLNFQVSDFFAFQNVVIDDLISDGQHFQSSFAPTLEVNGNGFTLAAAGMAGGNVNVVCNYTDGPGPECDSDNPDANDGTTAIIFDISAELVTRGRPDGKLLGGCVPAAGGSDYDCDPFNDGATTATVKFRAVILDAYTDNYSPGDPSVDQGDRLDNNVAITGAVLNNADLTPTGNSEADTSAAGLNIAQGSLQKTIYAKNGTACATQPCTNVQGTPGDTITYRLRYTHPTSDFEQFRLEDFLPLPVFSATEVASFSNTICSVPTAGAACLGPADTYHTLAGAVTPTMATNAANNTVKFTYGNYDNPANPTSVVDLLFTVTIEADPLADALYLTNQVRSTESSSQGAVRTQDAIVQIQIFEPVLGIRKGIIATDKAGATYNPTARVPANVTVSAPGSACPRLSGAGMPVTSSNLGTTFNSNLSGVDAGDLVTFAIVVENTGRGPNGAFDVRIKDNLPVGFVAPAGGINLCVTDGTSAAFTVTNVGGGTGLLDQGIELVDPGPTNPAAGGLDRGKLADGTVVADGRNIAIVTFDLQLTSAVQPGQNVDNTATLFNFAGQEGGTDFTTTDRTDTASTTIGPGARTKYLVATSEASTGAEGGTPRVTIGEIVRYRLVWAVPEGAATNAQFRDNLPPGLTHIDDGTARMAFVSNGAGFTSVSVGTLPVLAIPGGCTVTGATADATTPAATLLCTLADANVGSSNSTSADPDSYSTTGTDPYFKFGTLTNDDRDADSEWIVVEFNALVDNNSGANSNDYNDQLRNNFIPQVNTNNVGSNSNNVDVRVSEPCIGALLGTPCTSNLNKVVQTAPNPADAGGTVAYRVTYSNASNPGSPGATTNIFSTAFDVRMLDILPAGLQLNLAGVTVTLGGGASGTTNSSAGNTVDVTVASVPPGGTVQIDYSATLLDSALAGDDVQNTANLTYSSLPGANGTCTNATGSCNTGAQGLGTGERTGSGTAPNDYLGSDPASFTIPPPTVDKLAPSPASYTIGEVVTYNILVTVPEGTTQNLVVVDDLPAGLEYVAGSVQVITLASGSGGLLAADFNGTLPAYTVTAPGGSGGDVTLTFNAPPQPVATGDGVTTNNAFLVWLQARVLNVLGNQNGTVLTNNASVRYTDPESGVTTIADATPPGVTVVEPVLAVAKEIVSTVPSPPQVGSVATYRITVNHAAGSASTAYDTRITDFVPAGLTLNLGSISTTLNGGAAGVTNNSAGNTVDVVVASIPVGGSVVVEFEATISISAGLTAVNTAHVTWSTLSGADPNERSSGDGLLGGGGLNDYEVTSSTNPLAVTLASFTAQGGADRVTVAWETVSEIDNAGFNLYRTGAVGDRPEPSDLLATVPSQGPGSTQGFAYSYADLAVQPGQTYWYWLEDVSLGGATTLHGPVSATVQTPTAVTLGSISASPAAASTAAPWLWLAVGAGVALALSRQRRRNQA